MPSRYDGETKAKAVRLVKDHMADYETEWAAITAISARLGMSGDAAQVDPSVRRGRWQGAGGAN
jgi:hypothetical protein